MNTFEITVQRKVNDRSPVVVEYTLSDSLLPIRTEGELKIDLDELSKQATPLGYGTILGEALFRDKVLRAFEHARVESQGKEESQDKEGGLRILLFIEDPDLRMLRWEQLCISTDDSWSLDLDFGQDRGSTGINTMLRKDNDSFNQKTRHYPQLYYAYTAD